MPRTIVVTSALPYANGPIHLGHLVEYVQTDIWVRFQRMCGHRCYYFCADDTHGTPIMISARTAGIKPEQLIERVHQEHTADFDRFHVQFDNYYTTHSPENKAFSEMIFGRLNQAGSIVRREVEQTYCEKDQMPLPDRYVRGTCPRCGGHRPVRRLLRGLRRDLSDHRSGLPALRRLRDHAGLSDVGALFLQAVRLRATAAGPDGGRVHAEIRGEQARRMVPGRAEGLGHLPRWAVLRLQDSGRGEQVFLRLAGRPHRLHGLRQELLRPARAELRRSLEQPGERAVPLHRQGHHVLPCPVLAGDAHRRGDQDGQQALRPRLPHDQRREDEQVPRDVHQGRAPTPSTWTRSSSATITPAS